MQIQGQGACLARQIAPFLEELHLQHGGRAAPTARWSDESKEIMNGAYRKHRPVNTAAGVSGSLAPLQGAPGWPPWVHVA